MKDKVAIFLGKFQPPHLGHVRTILKIKDDYKKLIIGITEDEKILKTSEIKTIFIDIFKDYDSIDIMEIKGVVEQGTAKIPNDIDIVLSGNHKVLDKLSTKFLTKFIERTEGIGYSSTEIRDSVSGSKLISINKSNIDLKMQLVKITTLRPLELILPSHLKNIKKMIEEESVINKPLIVDKKDNIILDGSHRYAYLYSQGYEYAPVIFVDYDDEAIFVGNHLKHRFLKDEEFTISKVEVRYRAIHESLYPPRTTRHFFPFRKKNFPVKLTELKKGKNRNMMHLISKVSLDEEIRLDTRYINEIDEEIYIIQEYLKEQYETKKYLESQIDMMKANEK